MTDLELILEYLEANELLHKSIFLFSKFEMEKFCEAVIEATDAESGFGVPFLDPTGCLYIPANAPKKYRWWQGGQSISETLTELGASDEIKIKYAGPELPGKYQGPKNV